MPIFKYFNIAERRGQSVLELLIAMGVFVISMTAAFQLFFGGQSLSVDSSNVGLGTDYAQEGIEAAQNIRARNWNELTDGPHGLVFQNNEWMFGSTSVNDSKDIFTRTITIGTIDANTKIATTTITWQTDPLRTEKVELVEYLTNWQKPLVGGCSTGTLSGNWAQPRVLGSGDLGPGNEGTDVVVKLPYVFMSGVASSASKPDIFVFDVSNPSAPSLVASSNVSSKGINALYLKGNYLYAASSDDSKELIVFDISTPTSISEVASINLSGTQNALAITGTGNTVYLGREKYDGAGNTELMVIDVSTPASPSIATSFEISEDVNDVWASSERLYAVSKKADKDLWIYDVSTNPNNPNLLNTYDLNTSDQALSVSLRFPGDVLVGDGASTFFVLGATNTSQVYVRDSLGTGGGVSDIVCVADNLAFLATSNGGKEFLIINIADPTNITEYGYLNFPQIGTGIDFAENKAFMSVRSNDALRIITSQ